MMAPRGSRLRLHESQLPVRVRHHRLQGDRPLGGRADPRGHRGAGRQPDPSPARAGRQARVLPVHRRLRRLRGPARGPQAGGRARRGDVRRQPGRHARAGQGQAGRGRGGQLAVPQPVRGARARAVPRDLRVRGLSRPGGDRASARARGHGGARPPRPARDDQRPQCGARPEPRPSPRASSPRASATTTASAACIGSSASEVQPPHPSPRLLQRGDRHRHAERPRGQPPRSEQRGPGAAERADRAARHRGGPVAARLAGGRRPRARGADAAEPERGLGVEPRDPLRGRRAGSSSTPPRRISAAPRRPAGSSTWCR